MTRRLLPVAVFLAAMLLTFGLGQLIRGQLRQPPPVPPPLQELPPPPVPELDFPEVFVSSEALSRRLAAGEDLRLVDLRPLDGCAEARVLGARCGDPAGLDAACPGVPELACVRRYLGALGLSGRETVVLYADRRAETDALTLGRWFWLLEWAGQARVEILYRGLAGWKLHGGSVDSREPAAVDALDYSVEPRPEAFADVDFVRDHYGPGGVQLLDLRDRWAWREHGYEAPPRFAAGHVPYALPYDVLDLLDEHRWPTPTEGWERFRGLGPRGGTFVEPSWEYVVHGVDADTPELGLAYLLLSQMGVRVRVFAGGWRAWTEDPDNPVVRVVSAQEVAARLDRDDASWRQGGGPAPLPLFDLREEHDFRGGHLPGSTVLPWSRFPAEWRSVLEERWPGADPATTPIVFYCYGRDCIRSREAGVVAARDGFRHVWWLRDGVDAWQDAGLPLVTGGPGPVPPAD